MTISKSDAGTTGARHTAANATSASGEAGLLRKEEMGPNDSRGLLRRILTSTPKENKSQKILQRLTPIGFTLPPG